MTLQNTAPVTFSVRKKLIASLVNLVSVSAVIFILNQTVTKSSTMTLVWTCCVFSLMAMSLNITMGLMGQLALGHCGFMAIGAYLSTFVAHQLKIAGFFENSQSPNYIWVFLIGILVGGIGAAIVGFIVGMPALRLRGDYLAIITLGFGLIVTSVLNNIASPTLYAEDCNMYINKTMKAQYFWLIMAITAICFALIFTFGRSKYGRALMALRDNDIAASASGINASYYKVLGFTLSAFFAGIAGVLFATMQSSLSTNSFAFSNANIYNSVFIVVMVVLGGMGSLTGSIVAGIVMVLLNNLISAIPMDSFLYVIAKYPMLLYALILLVFIMFRPKGIFGTSEFSLYDSIVWLIREFPGKCRAFFGKVKRKKENGIDPDKKGGDDSE